MKQDVLLHWNENITSRPRVCPRQYRSGTQNDQAQHQRGTRSTRSFWRIDAQKDVQRLRDLAYWHSTAM